MTSRLIAGAGVIAGKKLARPVFILGTGRCGTTLLVKIFDSHPQLAGFPDEANDLWHPQLYPYEKARLDVPPIETDPARFTQASVDAWPPDQPDRIRRMFSGFHLLAGRRKVFFSKSAMTSFLIPIILELFPDARFIHVYRFGPSVVESYTKKNFGTYSRYQVAEPVYRNLCAQYWNDCVMEIEKQRMRLKLDERGVFAEVAYEKLCDDPSGELTRLAEFLGVDVAGFAFDLGAVRSTNYKAELTAQDRAWAGMLAIMKPALRLKGYIGSEVSLSERVES